MSDRFWRRIAKLDASFFMLCSAIILFTALIWALRPLQTGAIKLSAEESSLSSRRFDNGQPLYARISLPNDLETSGAKVFSSRYLADLFQGADQSVINAIGLEIAAGLGEGERVDEGELLMQHDDPARNLGEQVPDEEPELPETGGIRIVYQGMMVGLDQKKKALLDSPEVGLRGFHSEGTTIGAFTIGGFNRNSLKISYSGQEFQLMRGVPLVLEEEDRQ